MSDPAKSDQIEDVLSSIRRLVSDHQSTGSAAAGPAGGDAPEADGKLVLTPALRVTDPEDPWRPIPRSDLDGAEPGILRLRTVAPDGPFEADNGDADWPDPASGEVAEAVAALRQRRGDPAHATADAQLEADIAAWLSAADAAEASVEQSAPESDEDPVTEAKGRLDVVTDGPDSPEAAAKGLPPADEIAIEEGDKAAPAGTQAPDAAAAAAAPAPEEPAEPAAADGEDARPWATTPGVPLFSRRAARDRVVDLGAKLDTPRGDDALEDVEDIGPAEGLFAFPDKHDAMIDEDALRELVAEVVREELQGALGQRITRNVRKMVRREIRLALAAEGLE